MVGFRGGLEVLAKVRDSNKIRNSLLWTGAEKVLVYGLNFIQGVVLARLLKPEDFGFCTMLGLFLGIGGVLAESGLGTVLVVKVSGCRAACEKSAVVWNIAASLVLYAVLAAISPFAADWFGEPVLSPLLRVLALSLIFNSAGVVPVARLTRMEVFSRISWLNGIACVVGSFTGIAFAYAGCGVWSIAAMILCQAAIRTTLAWFWAIRETSRPDDGRICDADNRCTLRNLLQEGWKLTVSGIINTSYYNIYHLLIGKIWTPAAVGLFVRGQRWAQIAGEVVNDAVGRVALPRLVADDSQSVRLAILNMVLLWPALAALWLFADVFVVQVLGEQWVECVPHIRIFIIGQFATPVSNIALNLLKARDRADLVLASDGIKKPFGFLAMGIGCFFGVGGLCWAKAASDFTDAAVDLFFAFKSGVAGRRER